MASNESALAWIVSLKECQGISEQTARFQKLCNDASVEVQSVSASIEENSGILTGTLELPMLSCRIFSRASLPGEWLMNSYSALAGSGHSFVGAVRSVTEEDTTFPQIHSLPSGPDFGNVVHGLLEDYSFSLLAGGSDYGAECQGQCSRFGVTAESDQLMNLLRDVTGTPLYTKQDGVLFALADLDKRDLLKEMPFYFHLQEGTTKRINEILHFSSVVQPVQERKLKGYLTGFIDLVCRYRGKYYVMDYKTNYLGPRLNDYGGESLVAAMRDHNYGLQYWIYILVLHRYLKATLPEYDYSRDFGGVFYLFARGMSPAYPGNGLFFDMPQHEVIESLYDCLGAK